jgi:hypothetical protein
LAELQSRWLARVGARRHIPPLAVLHVDLGSAWQARGEQAAAKAHFARAATLAPDYEEALQGWAQANRHE